MSASRKKRERKLLEAEKAAAISASGKAKKTGVDKALRDVLIIIISVLLVAVIIVGVIHVINKNKLNAVIATVGEHEIKTPMMNFAYMDAINRFYNEYNSYLSFFLDSSKPLDKQECLLDSESANWGEYFVNQAATAMEQFYNVKDHAEQDGFTLSEDDLATVDSTISSVEAAASMYGTSADAYIENIYGDGCTLALYREYITLQQIAASYFAAYTDSIDVTDADITAKYDEDPGAFDGVTYYMVAKSASEFVKKNEDGSAADVTDVEKAEAEAAAKAVRDDFDISQLTPKTDAVKSAVTSSVTEEAATWLFDNARVDGDTAVFANTDETTYYAVRFVEKNTHDYATANCKAILLSAETTPDAENLYNSLLETINAENFDDLAKENNLNPVEQDNLASTGVSTEADEWLLDSARKAGDIKGISTESGYYIFLYTGAGEIHKNVLVKNSIITELQTKWQEEHSHTNPVQVNKDNMDCLKLDLILNSVFQGNTVG